MNNIGPLKLTVIVPVYKTELFLRKCIDSILGQTLKDFELILVDDGSPDNCPAICDEYARADSRVRVIHQENGGEGSVRKLGVSLAKGKYIGFVDSDDWIEPEMFDVMYNAAKDNDCDMVICGWRTYDLRTNRILVHDQLQFLKDNCIYDRSQIQEDILPKVLLEQIHGYPWNKIYRASILKQCPLQRIIGLPNNCDWVLNCEFFKIIHRMMYINKCLYNYILHQGGSLIGQYKDYFSVILRLHEYRMAFLKEFNLDAGKDIRCGCINRFMDMALFAAFGYEFLFSHTTFQEKLQRISAIVNNSEMRRCLDEHCNAVAKQGMLRKVGWWLLRLRMPLLIYVFGRSFNIARKIKRGIERLLRRNLKADTGTHL